MSEVSYFKKYEHIKKCIISCTTLEQYENVREWAFSIIWKLPDYLSLSLLEELQEKRRTLIQTFDTGQ